jgi:acyl-CoA reductase-like NAD-dependent aldehyde dehydrogenase
MTTVQGDIDVGTKLVDDKRIQLVSFTGSTKVGKIIQ